LSKKRKKFDRELKLKPIRLKTKPISRRKKNKSSSKKSEREKKLKRKPRPSNKSLSTDSKRWKKRWWLDHRLLRLPRSSRRN
jgi:hypothetical protein